ncbi:MAG: hypothetical protein K2J32_00745 [Ruminococcus sp.]|nr:hypothetical protein [Ruminococcus sp.]
MSFRDLNAKSNRKKCRYSAGVTFRDMNFRSVKEIHEEPEPVPEKKVTAPQQTSNPANHYQSVPLQSAYMNNPVQSVPLQNIQYTRPPQSVYIQPKPESQFLYYTQNNNTPAPVKPAVPVPPVPPRPPEPEKPDPSKFIEERTQTPPPKMVRVTVPVRKKVDNKNNDFGSFGTTFDGDPDQSTMITEIPVMNNIDDYKI